MFTLCRFAVFSCAAICAHIATAADTPLGPPVKAREIVAYKAAGKLLFGEELH